MPARLGETRRRQSELPGMWCFSHFSWYSTYLTPRNTSPRKRMGEDEEDNKQTPLPDLSSPDTQRHKKAGADQHSRIRRTQRFQDAELVRRTDGIKASLVPVAIEQVRREEQPAEEHDFRSTGRATSIEGAGFPLLHHVPSQSVDAGVTQRPERHAHAPLQRPSRAYAGCCGFDRVIQQVVILLFRLVGEPRS